MNLVKHRKLFLPVFAVAFVVFLAAFMTRLALARSDFDDWIESAGDVTEYDQADLDNFFSHATILWRKSAGDSCGKAPFATPVHFHFVHKPRTFPLMPSDAVAERTDGGWKLTFYGADWNSNGDLANNRKQGIAEELGEP